ncbi:MAG: radical SAM protein, partial [Pirellulaceae bacterium]
TARGTIYEEVAALKSQSSQYHPGFEIPERSWAYRIAKRICFNDFGAYSRHFKFENWQDVVTDSEQRADQDGPDQLMQIKSH